MSQVRTLLIAFSCAFCLYLDAASANENVVGRARQGSAISQQDTAAAQVNPQRTLTNIGQLSETIRATLNIKPIVTEALPAAPDPNDGKSHPFTTKNASADGGIGPVNTYPWRATGKMFMKFGAQTFVCTASVIGKDLLVTAAHCVHNFGQRDAGFADSITFEPARHVNDRPFGTWTGKEWWISKAYFDGTDTCSPNAPGVICENDVALVVLERNNNQSIADVSGKYGFKTDAYGYGNIFGKLAGQITQLGYPSKDYDGIRMIRTDSLGYQDPPNNVIIGSAQTGGSSGGPWLMNFGVKTSNSGTRPLSDDDNQVVATTSWGFTDNRFMIQGASRFGKNKTYTLKSNIESLHDSACGANAGAC